MGKFSRLLLAIVLVGVLTLPSDSRVGAVTFAFSGFKENVLHLVSNSLWFLNSTTGCFKFDPIEITKKRWSVAAGRLLYPFAVQVRDPGSTTVKSFSITFIYRLQIVSRYGYPNEYHAGPGMAFCMVPDNTTLGAPGDYMGLITQETTEIAKNHGSDDHTLGVELDIFRNWDFNDINSNHIGINLASINSIYSLKPIYSLASSSASLQQIWIDFHEADSRMDIFYANYEEGKPAEPQGSRSGLDLSLLKDNMYIGFSSANKIGGGAVPHVCAWSFSNDGNPAPSVVLAQDATPGAPPPPPKSDGSVTAPSLPPPASTPSPPPPPAKSPLLRAPNSSPVNARYPPPSSGVPSRGEPPTVTKKGGPKEKSLGVYVVVLASLAGSVGMIICIIVSLCWCRFRRHPLRIFISNAGGLTGFQKNFPDWLSESMKRRTWSIAKSRVKTFFDRTDIEVGKSFPDRILHELARFDIGVVVVTEAFFVAKWPMTELIAFVEAQRNDPTGRIRVLPLFYELTPEQVRDHLVKKTWEHHWEEMSRGNHPLQMEKCRDAVNWLCVQRGILYVYGKRDQDQVYIETICKEVDRILRDEGSFGSYLIRAVKTYCFRRCSKPRKTIPETEIALLDVNHHDCRE